MARIILTREDIANHLQLSVRQVDRLLVDWGIPHFRTGSSVRVRMADFEEWLRKMAHPMSLLDAALYFSFTPQSIKELIENAQVPLPHEKRGSEIVFYEPLLAKWRRELEQPGRIFVNIDDRTKNMRKLLAKKKIKVELLHCYICEESETDEKNVAACACHLCSRPVCFPHSLHYLRNAKDKGELPDVACDRCFKRFEPPTW